MQEPLSYEDWVRAGKPDAPTVTSSDPQQGPLSYEDWKKAGRPVPGVVGDVARSAAQGATFGFSDELRGVGAALIPGGQGYSEARDAEREALSRVPMKRRIGGELLGAVATAPLAAGKLLQLPKVARMGGIGRTAAVGAAEGAAYGAGTAEGDLGDRAMGAGAGAVLGGVAGGGLATAGKAAKGGLKLTGKLAKKAAENTATGAMLAEGVANRVLPFGFGTMGGYVARGAARRLGRKGHEGILSRFGGIGRRAGQAAAPDAPTGLRTPPAAEARPLTSNPARQIPSRTTASSIPMGPQSGTDWASEARRAAMLGRAGRPPAPITPPAPRPPLQIPAKSSAPIVTPAPRAVDPGQEARRAAMMGRIGRIGREVPESLVVPREASPGALRRSQSTQYAQRARDEKVDKLVDVIQQNTPEGVSASQVADFLENTPKDQLADYVQQAGVRPPSDETWSQVFNRLRRGAEDPIATLRAEGLPDEEIVSGLRGMMDDAPLEDQLRASLDLNQRLGRIGAR